jgi:hypothetical protein
MRILSRVAVVAIVSHGELPRARKHRVDTRIYKGERADLGSMPDSGASIAPRTISEMIVVHCLGAFRRAVKRRCWRGVEVMTGPTGWTYLFTPDRDWGCGRTTEPAECCNRTLLLLRSTEKGGEVYRFCRQFRKLPRERGRSRVEIQTTGNGGEWTSGRRRHCREP